MQAEHEQTDSQIPGEVARSSEDRPNTSRRWWRFRLSTLLFLVTLFTIWFAVSFTRQPLSVDNLQHLALRERMDVDIWKVVWSHDGSQVAFVGWETPVHVHDGVTLWKVRTIGEGKKIIHFAFSPDKNTVAYCENGKSPCLLQLNSGDTRVLETKPGQTKFSFSPDGKRVATGSYDDGAAIWEVASGQKVHDLDTGSGKGGLHPRFSPDGRTLAVGNRNSTTRLFDADTGELLVELEKRMTQELAFHPTQAIIAVSYVDGSIALWDTTNGSLLHEVKTTAEEIYTLDWSPDGTILASAGLNGDINLWRGKDLSLLHTLAAPEWVISIRFRPDMRGLVVAGGAQIRGGERFVEEYSVPSLPQKLLRGDW